MEPFVPNKQYPIGDIQYIHYDWIRKFLDVNGITRYSDMVDLLNAIILFYSAGLIQEKDRKYVIHPQFTRLSLSADHVKERIINFMKIFPYNANLLHRTHLTMFLIDHLIRNIIIMVKLKPLLIIDNHVFVNDLDVGNLTANQLIQKRIHDDYISVRYIVEKSLDPELKILDYSYETYDRGFIYVTVMKKDHEPFTSEDLKEITEMIDSRGPIAADTWMEGEIDILREHELDGTKYSEREAIEMGLEVVEIFDPK